MGGEVKRSRDLGLERLLLAGLPNSPLLGRCPGSLQQGLVGSLEKGVAVTGPSLPPASSSTL